MKNRSRAVLCLALLVSIAAPASGRELYWRELNVTATLDAAGTLHVSERHDMVFTGEWNGGERIFNPRPGQQIVVEEMGRLDDAGKFVPMESGSLDGVDHWSWVNPTTIRWRSRMPEDPAFNHTEIDYVINYTISNVLQPRLGGTWRLNHDFAFPDRPGDINTFVLNLGLDTSWQPVDSGPVSVRVGPIPPGQGYVLKLEMHGARAPGFADLIRANTDAIWRFVFIAIAVLLTGLCWLLLLRREERIGRFEPLRVEKIDWNWLSSYEQRLAPEVAAALNDKTVGQNAVSATLARLTAEGKIATWAENGVMFFEMRQPFEKFKGYDRDLIQALFIGTNKTNSHEIRTHYYSQGFNPAALIAPGVNQAAEALINEPAPRRSGFGCLAALAFLACIIAFGIYAFGSSLPKAIPILSFIVLFIWATVSERSAEKWRDEKDAHPFDTRRFMLPVALALLAAIATAIFAPPGLGGNALTALFAGVMLMNAGTILRALSSIAGPRRKQWWNRINRLEAFLTRQVKDGVPIEERYVPYVVALGLATSPSLNVAPPQPIVPVRDDDRWVSDPTISDPPHRPSFAGGGGAFGGAGASGLWAAAAADIAGGVAPPKPQYSSSSSSDWSSSSSGSDSWSSSDSSSSSSSSDSSSSDSGGGGGGGW